MARGSSIYSVLRGKLGANVLYRIKSPSNKERQGIREYVASPNNPKTIGQAQQRMKFKVVQAQYKILKSVIDRGFEGIAYGNASRLKFLSLSLRDYFGPFVSKDDTTPWPAAVTISKGSLPPISCYFDTGFVSSVRSDLQIPRVAPEGVDDRLSPGTVAELTKCLIAGNTDIQDGDQLTFVMCYKYDKGIIYRVNSINLSLADDDPLSKTGITVMQQGETGYFYSFYNDISRDENEEIIAAAVIQSRDGGTQHLRSTAQLALKPSWVTPLVEASVVDAALASYMSEDAASAIDWPVEKYSEDSAPVRYKVVSIPVSAITFQKKTAAGAWETVEAPANLTGPFSVAGFVAADGGIGIFEDPDNHLLDGNLDPGARATLYKVWGAGDVELCLSYRGQGASVEYTAPVSARDEASLDKAYLLKADYPELIV